MVKYDANLVSQQWFIFTEKNCHNPFGKAIQPLTTKFRLNT